MLGRVAYQDSQLLAELDARLFDSRLATEDRVLQGFLRYVACELDAGTPLKAMTRHLLGMRTGRPGGRSWRRALGELDEGRAGFAALCRLVGDGRVVDAPRTRSEFALAFDSR